MLRKANREAIAGTIASSLALTGVLYLVSHRVFDTTEAIVVSIAFFAFAAWRWWSFALLREFRERQALAVGLRQRAQERPNLTRPDEVDVLAPPVRAARAGAGCPHALPPSLREARPGDRDPCDRPRARARSARALAVRKEARKGPCPRPGAHLDDLVTLQDLGRRVLQGDAGR